MAVLDKYKDKDIVSQLLKLIHQEAKQEYTFMEVCGGHTMAIHRFGIPSMLPSGMELLSGPGCPVCVTSQSFIDQAIQLAGLPNTILATYGDLLKVPGSSSTLEKARVGGRIKVIFSPAEVINLALSHPEHRVIFLAIGFETTAPGNAIVLLEARRRALGNLFVLSSQKVMPPAMQAVVSGGSAVQGFICPGHVSAVAGTSMFEFLPRDHGMACVVSGFEPVDILLSILLLVRQINNASPRVEIAYKRAVKVGGNPKALAIMREVYVYTDDWWRGFGVIPRSGLKLARDFSSWDAVEEFHLHDVFVEQDSACLCGEILRGQKRPVHCPLFAQECTPASPVGACMVSSEGVCAAYFKYHRHG